MDRHGVNETVEEQGQNQSPSICVFKTTRPAAHLNLNSNIAKRSLHKRAHNCLLKVALLCAFYRHQRTSGTQGNRRSECSIVSWQCLVR
eukprot:3753819-Amphidinium_carterae.1